MEGKTMETVGSIVTGEREKIKTEEIKEETE
jgi:hypothetical protein